jgi:peptide/nickel transport system substrate-binding protein
VRRHLTALAVGVLVVGLAATGCSKNTGDKGTTNTDVANQASAIDYDGKAKVPAPEVKGAVKGGTLTIYNEGDFEHLSPQQIYVGTVLNYSQFFHRALTGYIANSEKGPIQLVGDLATNAGTVTDGGKTWTYKLRDGVKYDDGSPITSADIKYGIALSFGPYGVQGTQYLQGYLDPKYGKEGGYAGPGKGDLNVPGVSTPDDKTIVLKFAEPHTDIPYIMAWLAVPVPQAKFDNEKYEADWVSEGPYKRSEYVRGTRLVLERNPNWDPNTDPIRHAYPDKIVFNFTKDAAAQTEAVKASAGDDAASIMTQNVPPQNVSVIKADTSLKDRIAAGPTGYQSYISINSQRVTDVKVRQALEYAFDRDAYIKAVGGYDVADPASTLLAPDVPGYKKFDAYPPADAAANHGNVDKAKQLITDSGKAAPKLKYCTSNTPVNQKVAAVNTAAFKRAGFDFSIQYIEPSAYYTTVGLKTTDCDLITHNWAADWPDGDSTLGVLWDGTKIVPSGNNDLAYFSADDVNAKLAELRAMTDRGAAAKGYGDLDQMIMEKYAPSIPMRTLRNFFLKGTKVGGTFASPLYAAWDITGIYVMQ